VLALLNFKSFVSSGGYAAIFLLSVMQSCCIPTSSEITFGLAGYLAYKGQLNLAGVIAVGAAGEVVGAYIAWAVGRYGGRAFVDRYGKYVLLTHHDLDRAEGWFQRHDRWGVFASRLIPVIRNFAAVPAGVAEVPLVRFGTLTALGSLIWDGAMAGIGYGVGGSYDKVMKGFSYAGYVIAVVAVAGIAFVIWHRWRAFHATPAAPASAAAPSSAAAAAGASASASASPSADE
jgi:membrane protein DedA with SNARE-associated domain